MRTLSPDWIAVAVPGRRAQAHIAKVYGRKHALKVVQAAVADYDNKFAL